MIYPDFRARPSRLQTVKLAFLLFFNTAIVAFATYNLVHAVFTGELPTLSRHSHEAVHWARAPVRFILHFILWGIGDAMFGFGILFFARRLRETASEADHAGGYSR